MERKDYEDYEQGMSTLKDACEAILPLHMPGRLAHAVANSWASYIIRALVWLAQTVLLVAALCGELSWTPLVVSMVLGGMLSMCYVHVLGRRTRAWQAVLDHMEATYGVKLKSTTVEVLCVAKWRIALSLAEPGWAWSMSRYQINKWMREGLQ